MARPLERIVVIEDAIVPRGGATTLALLSVREFRARGIAVTYITAERADSAPLLAMGVDVVSIGHDGPDQDQGAKLALNRLYNFKVAEVLGKWIGENDRPGFIYHLHGWHSALSTSVFGALSKVSDRLVIHAHDYFTLCPNGAFYDYQRQTVCNLKPLSRACVTTNCDKRAYRHKLWRVVREGVRRSLLDLRRFSGRIILLHPDMAPYFEAAGLSPQCVVVKNPTLLRSGPRVEAERNRALLFVGRLVAEKGPEDALMAARAAEMPAIIVGDGPERARLQAEFPEAEFTGWLEPAEVAQVMRQARLLAMPSRYPEPYGMVCIEAAGAGVPVITPQAALLSSDVAASDFGYVCDTSNINAFAHVLIAARVDDAAILGKSERAYATAASLCLTPQAWADALLDVYRELLAQEAPVSGSSSARPGGGTGGRGADASRDVSKPDREGHGVGPGHSVAV